MANPETVHDDEDLETPNNKALHYVGIAFVSILLAVLILKSISMLGGKSNKATAKAPEVPAEVLCHPQFTTTDGDFTTGSAFAVKVLTTERRVLLTPLHLFGPVGKMPTTTSAADLPQYVQSANLQSPFAEGTSLGTAEGALFLPAAAPHPEMAPAGDIAAFWVAPSATIKPLQMSYGTLTKGNAVWVMGAVLEGAPADRLLHLAYVDAVDKNFLDYTFANSKLKLKEPSGLPVVNSSGELVGMHLGESREGGELTGFANPVGRFRSHLELAATPLRKAPPKTDPNAKPPVRLPPPPPPG